MCVCLFSFFSEGGQLVGLMPVLAACHLIYGMYFQLCCIVLQYMLWQIKFSLSLDVVFSGGYTGRLLTIDSKRLCAVRIENNEWKILIVCVYLPCEDGYANINAFSEEVSHLEILIDNNPDCHKIVVICGDFNVNF